MKRLPLFLIILTLAACTTITSFSKLTCTPEVRKQSFADDKLFHRLLTALGGVGHSDQMAYPDTQERTVVQITVLLPYGDKRTGSERWTIRHDANQSVVYQVNLVPDEDGTTSFFVSEVKK